LDVGVGSGAVALALADEHPGARITGVDTSPQALTLARENAERLGLPVELLRAGFESASEGWDLVVANPPYVRAHEWDSLQPEIREWEPRTALVGEGMHEELLHVDERSEEHTPELQSFPTRRSSDLLHARTPNGSGFRSGYSERVSNPRRKGGTSSSPTRRTCARRSGTRSNRKSASGNRALRSSAKACTRSFCTST